MAAVSNRARKLGASGPRGVAVLAWVVAWWTTTEFLTPITEGANWTPLAALILQAIFTGSESAIWAGKGRWYNWLMLAIDVITNIGGLYFYMTRLDKTDSWAAFQQGLSAPPGGVEPLTALIISVIAGVLLAAAPEMLWKSQE